MLSKSSSVNCSTSDSSAKTPAKQIRRNERKKNLSIMIVELEGKFNTILVDLERHNLKILTQLNLFGELKKPDNNQMYGRSLGEISLVDRFLHAQWPFL